MDKITFAAELNVDQVELIGAIVTGWAACEQTLFETVMFLRGYRPVRYSNVAWPIQTKASKLITQWRAVADIVQQNLQLPCMNLDALESDLIRFNWIRNLVVHGFYDHDYQINTPTISMIKWDEPLGTFVDQPYIITADALAVIVSQLRELLGTLLRWEEAVFEELEARAATNPKDGGPERPEVLLRPPKPL